MRKNFKELKGKVNSDTYQQPFNTTKPVTLQVDASKVGLGAVLKQEGQPSVEKDSVAFASKSLNPN